MAKIKVYLDELSKLKKSDLELTEDDILRAKDFFLRNIENLGSGDPMKAANVHYRAIKYLHTKISGFKDYKTVH